LAFAEEAAAIFRRLAEDEPDVFLPEVAKCLTNLADSLAASGRQDEAMRSVNEAIEIRRRLSERYPTRYRSDLDHSLRLRDRLMSASKDC
jgi:tetratricopeptide (TPR) repeat protein